MSTTMQNTRLVTRGEPMSRGRARGGRPTRGGLAKLERWAAAKPALVSLTLSVLYLVALATLVAVLAASALNTVVGIAVMVLYAAMVLVCIAVGIYVVIPERRDTRTK